jgi:hypothetical protein
MRVFVVQRRYRGWRETMALTLTYEQWLRDTELNAFKPRSSALQAVDEAMEQYQGSRSEKDLWRVRNAFEDWKRAEGPRWEASGRNRKLAITRLDRELAQGVAPRTYQITHMSTEVDGSGPGCPRPGCRD